MVWGKGLAGKVNGLLKLAVGLKMNNTRFL